MSETLYKTKRHFSCRLNEFIAMIVTSFFASFILSFNKWGGAEFDMAAGLTAWGLSFVFFLFFIIVAVFVAKLIAVKMGYLITYESHLVGLFIGLIICVASSGYLPLFLPGGFSYKRPDELAIGHFKSRYKGWEIGLISSIFPAIMMAFVLVLSPLFLASQDEFYAYLLLIVCLTAIYACIPLPNFTSNTQGRRLEWFKYMKGCTFGLDILYVSGPWYVIFTVMVLLFSLLTWILTSVGTKVGIVFYILAVLIGIIGWFVYIKFFEKA